MFIRWMKTPTSRATLSTLPACAQYSFALRRINACSGQMNCIHARSHSRVTPEEVGKLVAKRNRENDGQLENRRKH